MSTKIEDVRARLAAAHKRQSEPKQAKISSNKALQFADFADNTARSLAYDARHNLPSFLRDNAPLSGDVSAVKTGLDLAKDGHPFLGAGVGALGLIGGGSIAGGIAEKLVAHEVPTLAKKFAILTAEKSGLGDEEKALRNEWLHQKLEMAGHKPVKIRGVDPMTGDVENSFLVHGMDPAEAELLGREHQQQAVVTHLGYHDLEKNTLNPAKGVRSLKAGESGAFGHSELPDGQRFTVDTHEHAMPVDFSKPEQVAKPGASIQYPDGRNFVDVSHGFAGNRALEAGMSDPFVPGGDGVHGFNTTHGRFLLSDEAYALADAAEQTTSSASTPGRSYGLNGKGRGGLNSEMLLPEGTAMPSAQDERNAILAKRDAEGAGLEEKKSFRPDSIPGADWAAKHAPHTSFLDGSAVTDRVFHGTAPSGWAWRDGKIQLEGNSFDEFRTPAYFASNPEYASGFAEAQANERALGNGARVIPARLSIKKPFDARGDKDYWRTFKADPQGEMSRLKALGHDGVRMHEVDPSHPMFGDVWVPFEPHQIRNAISENGRAASLAERDAAGAGLTSVPGDWAAKHAFPEQTDLPRHIGPRTSPQRLADVEDEAFKTYTGPQFEKWAKDGNFANWYDTRGTESKAIDALGETEGPESFKRLMDIVAAVTARSDPANNLRRATYYRGLENAGLLDADALRAGDYKKVPTGMGHLANNAHHSGLATLLEQGAVDPLKNPKPAGFTANLTRNWKPATNDTRMATGAVMANPKLLDIGAIVKSVGKKGEVTYSPRDWAYAPMERAMQRAGDHFAGRGFFDVPSGASTTAPFQAKVWDAIGADLPGASRSQGIFDDVFNDKLAKNAKAWGVSLDQANKLMWEGHPLDLPLNKDVIPKGLLRKP